MRAIPDTAALLPLPLLHPLLLLHQRLAAVFHPTLLLIYSPFSRFAPVSAQNMSDKTGKQDAAAPSSSAAALLNQPIVLDTGTGTTRAGFAGGTKPKVRVCMCG